MSDIFKTLQETMAARLNDDAFFSDPARLVTVLAENRMDLYAEYDRALTQSGMGAVVAVRAVAQGEHGNYEFVGVNVAVVLEISEVPLINRDASGSRRTALEVGVKAMSLWGGGWTPDEDVWSRLEFKRLELTQVDEEHGRIIWTLEMQTQTFLQTQVDVLGDGSGNVLVDETGAPLMVTPTDV